MTTKDQITLPEPDGKLYHEAREYEQGWVSSEDAYAESTVRRLIAEAIEAYKAKLVEGVGEPVGWYSGRDGEYSYDIINLQEDVATGTDLYTADQLAAAVAKERDRWTGVTYVLNRRIAELETKITKAQKETP